MTRRVQRRPAKKKRSSGRDRLPAPAARQRSYCRARSARFTLTPMCAEKALGWPNPNQIWIFFLSTPKTKVVVLVEIGGLAPLDPCGSVSTPAYTSGKGATPAPGDDPRRSRPQATVRWSGSKTGGMTTTKNPGCEAGCRAQRAKHEAGHVMGFEPGHSGYVAGLCIPVTILRVWLSGLCIPLRIPG